MTTPIPLLLSQEHNCSYLDGKMACSTFVDPSCKLTTAIYTKLIMQGFRRNGDIAYKPCCQKCISCVPSRLVVSKFAINRSQKRCWKKNRNTQVIVKSACFEQEHYDMYLRYQAIRHDNGSAVNSSPQDYIGFLKSSWCESRFIEFLIEGELAAVAVIDELEDSWSAVYTFFEPKFADHSLGVYAVLWEIDQLQKQKREFLYLGFWIKACKKMTYKSNYQPMQLLIDNQWVYYSEGM